MTRLRLERSSVKKEEEEGLRDALPPLLLGNRVLELKKLGHCDGHNRRSNPDDNTMVLFLVNQYNDWI